MSSRFTEQETESYYDSEDAIYRAVWDEEGSVHWGVFDDSTGDDFLKACANLNDLMVAKGRIDSNAKVLELSHREHGLGWVRVEVKPLGSLMKNPLSFYNSLK